MSDGVTEEEIDLFIEEIKTRFWTIKTDNRSVLSEILMTRRRIRSLQEEMVVMEDKMRKVRAAKARSEEIAGRKISWDCFWSFFVEDDN